MEKLESYIDEGLRNEPSQEMKHFYFWTHYRKKLLEVI